MVRTIQKHPTKTHLYKKKIKQNKIFKTFTIQTYIFFRTIVATLNIKQGHSVIDAKHSKSAPIVSDQNLKTAV